MFTCTVPELRHKLHVKYIPRLPPQSDPIRRTDHGWHVSAFGWVRGNRTVGWGRVDVHIS